MQYIKKITLFFLLAIGLHNITASVAAPNNKYYTIKGIRVDITGRSALEAQKQALIKARRLAFENLLKQLLSPEQIAKLPPIDNNGLEEIENTYEIVQQHHTNVRFIATYNFQFNATKVKAYCQNVTTATVSAGKRGSYLVVPLFLKRGQAFLWDNDNPWMASWNKAKLQPDNGLPGKLVLPLGDLKDMQALRPEQVVNKEQKYLYGFAKRYGMEAILITQAEEVLRPGEKDPFYEISLIYFTPNGKSQRIRVMELQAPDHLKSTRFAEAVQVTLGTWRHVEKNNEILRAANDPSNKHRLVFIISISKMDNWPKIARDLQDIPGVIDITLDSLMLNQVKAFITYKGPLPKLEAEVINLGLSKQQNEQGWLLTQQDK